MGGEKKGILKTPKPSTPVAKEEVKNDFNFEQSAFKTNFALNQTLNLESQTDRSDFFSGAWAEQSFPSKQPESNNFIDFFNQSSAPSKPVFDFSLPDFNF